MISAINCCPLGLTTFNKFEIVFLSLNAVPLLPFQGYNDSLGIVDKIEGINTLP